MEDNFTNLSLQNIPELEEELIPQPQRRTQLLTGHSLPWPVSSLATFKMRVDKVRDVCGS